MLKDIEILASSPNPDAPIVSTVGEYKKFCQVLALIMIKAMEDHNPMIIIIAFDYEKKKFILQLKQASAIII
jgi:hypothetical protein